MSPGEASARLRAEWHPLPSWVHFSRTTQKGGRVRTGLRVQGQELPRLSPGPAGAARTPLPGKPAAPHWEMTNDQKINL